MQPEPVPDTIGAVTVTAKPLDDIDAHECRWPLGPLETSPMLFCGAPALDGRPYCYAHRMASKRREDLERAA